MAFQSGRHFLQIPGPTNVPDRVLRATDYPTIDHRGPEFARLCQEVLEGLKPVFGTAEPVIIFTASGTGAWEGAMVNTLSPGDRILMFETGQFAILWRRMAERLGLEVEFIEGDWRRGVDPALLEERLSEDRNHSYKAVCVVHNETASGVTSDIGALRKAMDAAGHPALLMVDAISSLGATEYRHDDWGVDVTVAGSQKGLMVPPGLSFNAISKKALEASKTAKLPRSYWRWDDILESNKTGYFPSTPATNLLYGLREALTMMQEEGLPQVFARHARLAEATRRAAQAWGLEILCQNPAEYSNSLTTLLMPEGRSADALRKVILENFDMSLGAGLGKYADKVFRIGHLGHFNDLMLAGTLAGVEMGLRLADVPHQRDGIRAALDHLAETAA